MGLSIRSHRIISLNLIMICAMLISGCGSLVLENKSPKGDEGLKNDHEINPTSNINKKNMDIKNNENSHLAQCNRDLESLHAVNQTEYRRYANEFDGLMKNSAGFMTVKDDMSPEVAELARPRFQFALVNLCYRIKDALAQTFINQAGGR